MVQVSLSHAGEYALACAVTESGAGDGSMIPDGAYEAQGAQIVPDAESVFEQVDLVLKVKGLKRLAKAASGAGEVELTVKPTRKMVRTLDRKGEAKVVARVTYTPTGGDPNTESKRLTLKLRRGSR